MSAWDVAARSRRGRGPPPVPSMMSRVAMARRSYHRGAPRVSRGASERWGVLEERPGFAGALRTSGGLEERPGFAGALRTLGGLEERPGFAGALRTLGGF